MVAATKAAVHEARDALQNILDQIPTDKTALFAYPIQWTVIDKHDVVRAYLHKWIVKKIVDFLGEEETSLTSFIESKLVSHCRPEELVEELTMVLDEDSEGFVMKLWRMLVYYSLLKAQE